MESGKSLESIQKAKKAQSLIELIKYMEKALANAPMDEHSEHGSNGSLRLRQAILNEVKEEFKGVDKTV